MGGQVRLVHVTTLNGSVARLVSCRERTRGAGFLLLGLPAPFVYPLASLFPLSLALARRRCCRFCGPGFSLCCLAGGYAPPLSVAPRFWIVYALAMRVSAYYALGLGLFVCASHGAVLSCGACCGVWWCRARGCGVRLAFR